MAGALERKASNLSTTDSQSRVVAAARARSRILALDAGRDAAATAALTNASASPRATSTPESPARTCALAAA